MKREKLTKMFEDRGKRLLLVGGPVRDMLLGVEPKDFDFATDALPAATITILKENRLKVIPIGMEFGTVGTRFDGEDIEITTFRTAESYKKGDRKPDVVFGTDLTLDLSRRDFTINAVAFDGKYIDPFDGIADLHHKVLRTPVEADVSFGDDPLRILRAARFIAKYDLTPVTELVTGAVRNAKGLADVSPERVFDEFTKLLMVKDPTEGLEFLALTGALAVLFPELQKCVDFKKNQGKHHIKTVWPHLLEVVAGSPQVARVRWAALFHDVAKPQTYSVEDGEVHFLMHEHVGSKVVDQVLLRLRASNKFRKDTASLVRNHMKAHFLTDDNVTDKALRRFVTQVDDRSLVTDLMALNRGDLTSKRPGKKERLIAKNKTLEARLVDVQDELATVVPALPKGFGTLLIDAGIPVGPELGRIMQELTQRLVDGDLTLDDDLLAEALK